MKKTILLDYQIFRKQEFGGISRYFAELICGINKQPGYRALPGKFYSNNIYLHHPGLTSHNKFGTGPTSGYKRIFEKMLLKLENYKLRIMLKKGNFSVFHPTYYDTYFLKYLPPNKSLVITVHDMTHENYYDNLHEYLSEESKHKLALIERADHIIAVSNYTQSQILKHFPDLSPDKISVIYHGPNIKPDIRSVKPGNLPGNYLLFVGVKKHYKNFFWLAEALKDYLRENNLILLCAGSIDFDVFEQKFLSRLELKGHVKYIPINSEEELAAIYENAICFIFPSLEEGFGMPILEAFACSCPVILSNSSAFPEIAGDAAVYFEPGDKEELIRQIEIICGNNTAKQELINKGRERLKLFSWAKTVDEHIKIYDKLSA